MTPPPAQSAPQLTELRQLTETLSAMGADPEQSEEAAGIRERIADLRDRLQRMAWRSDGRGSVARHIGLARVQDLIRTSGRQMVLYGRAGGDLIAVVIGPSRPRLLRLPATANAAGLVSRLRADLNALAYATLTPPMRQSASASARRCLDRLDALLLAPLELSDRALVIIPTADLSTLPWNALPSLRQQPVEISPTASAWWRGFQHSVAGPVRVAAFAGPGLVGSQREVFEVHRIWPNSEMFVGAEATGRVLAKTAGSVSIAHVAAHGTHVSQNPLFSSLQLSDGPLFAYELEAGKVPPHVVLSACELGQVTVRPGEEALGLTSVLLQLGAQCVVAGVANVNDEVAAEAMVGYHRRLAAGSDAAAALADAVAASGTVVPFSCFGAAWSAKQPSSQPSHSCAEMGTCK